MTFRVKPDQKEKWSAVAASKGKTLSDWICGVCNKAAGLKPERRHRPAKRKASDLTPKVVKPLPVQNDDYNSVPFEVVKTIKVKISDGGELRPAPMDELVGPYPSDPVPDQKSRRFCFKCSRAARVGNPVPADCPDCKMMEYDPFEGM